MASEPEDAPPRLEVVGDAAQQAADPAAAEPQRSRRSLALLLLVLLLLAALGLVVQTRRVQQLEGLVAELGSDLALARREIDSYEGQLGRVRGLVDDLGARLEELREILEPDPASADAPEEAL